MVGIVVCVSFVLPQWPGARSQAVTGAAERLLQKAAGPLSAPMAFFQENCSNGRPRIKQKPQGVRGRRAEGAELKGVAPCGHLYRARPRTPPSTGTSLSPDLRRAGRRSPTMSCSPVRASREQICPLQLLFNGPEGKWKFPVRFFFFLPLRTFSAM